MKLRSDLQNLYRSPLKSGLTLLLLAVAAFLFLYNLSEYSVANQEYKEARDKYEGVLTVEESPVEKPDDLFDLFLLSDETNPGRTFDRFQYSESHHESLSNETIQALSDLPYVSRVERRYMTAGVSDAYYRLDMDKNFYPYDARCILVATVANIYDHPWWTGYIKGTTPEVMPNGYKCLDLEDIELLAGDPSWLKNGDRFTAIIQVLKDEYKNEYFREAWGGVTSRFFQLYVDDHICESDYSQMDIQIGRKYVFILRNNNDYEPEWDGAEAWHTFHVGDDTRIGWWPYITDVTELADGWLEQDKFAQLRELIQVTNDDVHTFDVVYGDDMASIRRVADGRIVCADGRFITSDDAGQPVCVVNEDFLSANELEVGDKLTLKLGNYLCETYAPLGAVAATKGRYSTAFTEQEFTIIGSWRDLNEGNHVSRDLNWCWSNNAIFVPTAFVPDCVNADTYTPKPAEVSFVVGQAEKIVPFMEKSVPQLEEMGALYQFSDGGWIAIADELILANNLARTKLLIFSGAAVLAMILTVWVFIGRKKKEFGILRALGMSKGKASNRLFVPFAILGIIASFVGLIVVRIVTQRQLLTSEAAHAPAEIGLFLLGALCFLILLLVIAFIGLLLIRRKSILELVQEKQK